MKARTVKVYEYEKLKTLPDQYGRYLDDTELKALIKFNDENDNKYFTVINQGIRFSQYVGVIQVGNLTLEILPKADRVNHYEESEADKWRGALLSMLKVCNKLSADAVNEANLKRRPMSMLDLYFRMFLKELELLLHQGLFKKYKKETNNIKAWKGRMHFSKNLQHNLIRKDRFYTTHEVYSYDHTINRILLKTLNIITQVSSDIDIIHSAKNLASLFPEQTHQAITESTFKRLPHSRKLVPYRQALKISEIIILNFSPEIKSGGTKLLALLFDMNKLWEEYLFRMLCRVERESFQVSAQQSQKFWNWKSIRPDIVIKLDKITYIIDAKWKIIDRKHPADADLKQMYVYNMYWEAEKSMLLYPKAQESGEEESFGVFHKGREGDNLCKLGFVKVLDENGKLDQHIGDKIIAKLTA